MFSIIIPLYNKSPYIEKCLQSVLNQTYRKFELVIINDGSTDDGVKKAHNIFNRFRKDSAERDSIEGDSTNKKTISQSKDEIQINFKQLSAFNKETISMKSRISFEIELQSTVNESLVDTNRCKITFINQSNLGVSSARNNGISHAKYDYIAFLDADDWWDEHFLDEMRILIEKFPEAVLYGCNYYYFKNNRSRLENKGLPKGFISGYINYISLYATKFVVPINCSFAVVRKEELLLEKGFNSSLKFGEDFDLWIRLALKHKVAYLNKPLAWSNQDSEKSNRAIGNLNAFKPSENVIFNLDYISNKEKENRSLNILLDGLRVRLLVNYYLIGEYKDKVREELKKVDFSKQTFYYIFIYKGPRILVRFFFKIRRFGSIVKQSKIGISLSYHLGIHTKINFMGEMSK